MGCGRCEQCTGGQQQICDNYFQPGFTAWGAFAEFVALPFADTNLVRLPDEMTFEEAAVLGCRFITAYRGIIGQGKLQPGQWVAIYGCGGVGLSAILIARAAGALPIACGHPAICPGARRKTWSRSYHKCQYRKGASRLDQVLYPRRHPCQRRCPGQYGDLPPIDPHLAKTGETRADRPDG